MEFHIPSKLHYYIHHVNSITPSSINGRIRFNIISHTLKILENKITYMINFSFKYLSFSYTSKHRKSIMFVKFIEISINKCMLEKRLVFRIRNYMFVKNLEYLLGWIHHFYFLFKRNGQQRNPRFYDTNYYFTYSVSDINMTFEILLFYSNKNTSGLDIPFRTKNLASQILRICNITSDYPWMTVVCQLTVN